MNAAIDSGTNRLTEMARGKEPPGYDELVMLVKETMEPFSSTFPFCQGASLYELYTKEYIMRLTRYLKTKWVGKRILEVCAGDGRLTRFLQQEGVSMLTATDTKDGKDCDLDPIVIGEDVLEFEAIAAVDNFNPALVIIAWPPYGSTVPEQILEKGIPIIFIGEGDGGCCGSDELWEWPNEQLECSAYSLCRTDYFGGELTRDGIMHHSLTSIFRPKATKTKEDNDVTERSSTCR